MNPDVGAAKNGCQLLVVDSDTDVEEAEALPDVVCPERHRTAPNVPKKRGVGMETANPDVGGAKNGCWAPVDSDTDVEMENATSAVEGPQNGHRMLVVDSDTDVEMENAMSAVEGPQNGHQMLVVDSDTDVEEQSTRPDVGCPQTPQTTQNEPKPENTEMETHDADVEGSQKGQQMLMVDSDTDVEENGANPDVEYSQTHQTTPNVPKPQIDEMEMQKADVEGSQRGHRVLVVGGDTDVEEDTSHPDVGGPQNHRTAPQDPGVKAETPDVEERQPLLVESDTDVEEDTSDPDVGTPKAHPATHNVPRPPQVEAETPNPRAKGPQNDRWTLVVDSDTDVEENEGNPCVGRPKIHRITHQDPDVGVKNPNPDVGEPQNAHYVLEADSDTDVEGDSPRQRVLLPRSHKTPQNTRQDPTVVMETPNPGVGGLSHGSVASSGDSDTDVEDLNPLPDVGGPKAHGTTPEVVDTVAKMAAASDVDPQGPLGTKDDPDVKVTRPAPDVGAPKAQSPVLNVDSDTDIEDDGSVPDVGTVQGCEGAPGGPDVAAAPPNPDVSSPASPGDGSDTDMEEVAPTPDVRSLRSRIRSQNRLRPDVGGPTMGSDTNVGERDPNRWQSSPKRQSLSPESCGNTSVEEMAPNQPDSAPNADVEAPNPDVEARQRDGESPGRGTDPAVPPDVSAPKSPPLARNLGGTGDAEGGPRSGGDVGAAGTGSDTDAEEVPDLFLEPTQNFLPPAAEEVSPWCPHIPMFCLLVWWPPQGCPQCTPMVSPHPQVLFTGVVASPGMEVALKTLGGSMATSVFDCTHLVTDRVRRTVKFLCAVARGIPIVTPEWLHKSAHSGRVLVPGPFLVRDSQQERHFGFSLAQALRRARRHPLLQGYEVHVTPSARPEPEHMKDIVTCSGGTFLPTMPDTYGVRGQAPSSHGGLDVLEEAPQVAVSSAVS
ncbi:mediator of DNA damage checkpoint protein 1-like [Egretta garzetta]|uniref:mediator of DNA damage checkpoint protein 1-like n=1 Tax=Egretta garzetta TaxID=188379 RepID=UPI00163CDF8A|nr:mediator of DNA damage checkpoint protein 1-like [Egretta garzetta]